MFLGPIVRHWSKFTRSEISRQIIRSRTLSAPASAVKSDNKIEKREYFFVRSLRDTITKQKKVDWDQIRREFSAMVDGERYASCPYPTAVFLALADTECRDHLRQFVEHMGMENLSVTLLAKYMKFCEDPDEVLRCWKIIQAQRTVFTTTELHYIVAGLIRTESWRQVLELLGNDTTEMKTIMPLEVAMRMFEAHRFDEAIELLSSGGRIDLLIDKYSNPAMEGAETAEKFLKFVHEKQLRLKEKFEVVGNKSWEKHYRIKETSIVNSVCRSCGAELPTGDFTPEEVSLLTNSVKERILQQDDIYLTTTPAELDRFEKYVEKHGPFDVVIDGMNLMYKSHNPAPLIRSVCENYAARDFKRILILVRNHVRKRYQSLSLPPEVKIYPFTDVSEDDPYILLSPLLSGPDCRLLSSDYFRNHCYKLRDMLKKDPSDRSYELFMKWLSVRRDSAPDMYRFLATNHKKAKRLDLAPKHFIIPHVDPEGYHIPYAERIGSPARWICVRRRPKDLLRE